MSNFTLGVAILAGIVLALVVAWTAWTTRRLTPMQPKAVDSGTPAGTRSPNEDAQRQEPVFDSGIDTLPVPEKRAGLDALIDVITPIALEAAVSGDAALAAMPTTRRAGSKPFAIEGLDEATGEWETPHPGHRYRAFQAGVQLANRTGALNEIEYSEF